MDHHSQSPLLLSTHQSTQCLAHPPLPTLPPIPSHPPSCLGFQARLPHPRAKLFGPVLIHRHQVHAPTLRRKQGRDGGKKPVQDLPPVLPSCPAGLNAPGADFGGGGGDVGGVEEEDVDGVEEAGEEGEEEVDLEGFEVGDLRRGWRKRWEEEG